MSVRSTAAARPLNNLKAIGAPTSANDNTQGYGVGSRWLRAATAEEWVCRDATTAAARWAKFTAPDHPGYVAGRRYLDLGGASNTLVAPNGTPAGGQTVPATRMWLYPALVRSRYQIDQLGAYVGANPDTAGSFMLATYGSDPVSRLPTGLPILQGANSGPTSTAQVSVNLDLASATYLEPGLYWRAFQTNTTTNTSFIGFNGFFSLFSGLVGAISASNPVTPINSSPQQYGCMAYGQSYGTWSDLTGTTEASYSPIAGAIAPAMWFRVSAVG